jgi:hypothetical protein
MKKFKKIGCIAVGIAIALVLSVTVPTLAASATAVVKQLTANFTVGGNSISIYVDGGKIAPKDGNGNAVEPFVVDGTTYLPIRAVSEALGKSVSWDGATASVYIGEMPGKADYMTDILPAYQSNGGNYKEYSAITSGGAESFSMGGVKYLNGMSFGNYSLFREGNDWAVWNLNGQYNSLAAVLGHIDGEGGYSDGYVHKELRFDIFCDGVLRDSFPIAVDMLPKPVSVDLRGVMQLKIVINGQGDPASYAFGNPILK